MSLENFYRSRRLFILGAGFSVAAGVPLTSKLLETTMKNMANDCPGLYERINNYAKEYFSVDTVDYLKINFPELCTFLEYHELREYCGLERFSSQGSREKLALKFYLSKTIAEHTPKNNDIPDIYLQFAEQLHDGDIILSFNWDCLLESALNKLEKKYTYDFKQNTTKLCKLHGSINWLLDTPNDLGRPIKDNILEWQKLNLSPFSDQDNIYQSKWLIYKNDWEYLKPLREVKPYIILPGYGKALDVRPISNLWYKPEFAFAATHDVYIIGLSLSPDDFFIRSFFIDNLPYIESYSGIAGRKIFIINPDKNIKKNYDFILDSNFAELICEEFGNHHIDLIKGRLKSE